MNLRCLFFSLLIQEAVDHLPSKPGVVGSGTFLNQPLYWVTYIPFAKGKSFLLNYKLGHSLVWK